MKKNPMIGAGCLLALTLSGCAAGAPATVVDATTGPAAQVSSWLARHAGPSWSDCPAEALPELDGVAVQCGTIAAPIDWSRADTSDSVDLELIRVSVGGPHDEVLMVNPGGPGVPARDMALGLATVPEAAPVLEKYDVVGIEPRGLTPETDLACDAEALAADGEGAVEACATTSRFAVHASTTDVAMDHELLRRALQQPELDYYGASYGTYIGSVYATLFPDTVGRMLLDSVADTAALQRTSDLEGFEESLGRLLDACTSGALGACPVTGDREAASEQLTALLQSLSAEPRTAIGPDGEKTEVGGREVASYLLTSLYEPRSSWSETIGVLDGVLAGDAEALEIVASTDDSVVDRALEYAVYCAVPPVPGASTSAAEGERPASTGPLGILEEGDESVRDCDRWGEYERLDPALSYSSGNRILIVSNLHDPATPIADARRLHDTELTNSTLVEVEADGHGAVYRDSTCATDIANAYLVSGTLPADPTRCETDR
ncbi:TAP-like protein [Rathayibacter sp. PhB93]|uniref:alpha/beta fold hydrolase n=1 Tax=unclassified Rathayibacter TaxID=2609250 RepID=UPI000FA9119E|nr:MULTISPECIES: alpha/beta fold hydrolase [unclassified Rathayibacter]ROQ06427.1 TAP-like protein [Rathayibacter sp. PhB93]TDQ14184.1 TAP-like protein [Rathayibacter sp. PhB1]